MTSQKLRAWLRAKASRALYIHVTQIVQVCCKLHGVQVPGRTDHFAVMIRAREHSITITPAGKIAGMVGFAWTPEKKEPVLS